MHTRQIKKMEQYFPMLRFFNLFIPIKFVRMCPMDKWWRLKVWSVVAFCSWEEEKEEKDKFECKFISTYGCISNTNIRVAFLWLNNDFALNLWNRSRLKLFTMAPWQLWRIFEVVTVGTHHDCEENEIVKWFPLYEGDAMFPAKRTWCFKQRLFFSKNIPLKKRFTWMDFWDWDTRSLSGLDLGVVLLPHDGPAFLDPSAIKRIFMVSDESFSYKYNQTRYDIWILSPLLGLYKVSPLFGSW